MKEKKRWKERRDDQTKVISCSHCHVAQEATEVQEGRNLSGMCQSKE